MFAVFSTPEIKNLGQIEFRSQLKQAKRPRLIDVSTKEEYKELHIPGSMNMDVLKPDFTLKLEQLDRSRTYFIYSRSGNRGKMAAKIMAELGFLKVFNLISGINSWKGTLERSY